MKRFYRPSVIRNISCALGLAFVLLFEAHTAFAGEERALDQRAAHDQFERALDLNGARDFTGAKKLLLALWRQYKTYDVASELGRSEFQLGDMASAAKHTAFALAHLPPHEQADTVKLHQNRLNRALAKIQRLEIVLTPPDAEIAVDGIVHDVPPEVGLFLSPGTHVVSVSRDGYKTETRTVDAKENATGFFTVELKKLDQSGTADSRQSIERRDTSVPPNDASPGASTSKNKPWVVLAIGGSLTVLAIGSGAYFHISGSNSQSDADSKATRLVDSGGCTGSPLSSDCAALNSDLSDRNSSYKTAKILYGTGAALGVTTAVLTWVLWPSRSTPASTHFGAWATPDGAGIAANGRF